MRFLLCFSIFFPLHFLILLATSPPCPVLSPVPFFRGTTRPFNRAAFSLARDPAVPSYSAIASLFQLLRLSYTSLPLSVSAALYSLHSVSQSLQPLGELYPVNRSTLLVTVCNLTEDQTKRDPTYRPPPFQPIYLLYFTLSYPILSTYPLIPSHRMSSRKTRTWESMPREYEGPKERYERLPCHCGISRI